MSCAYGLKTVMAYCLLGYGEDPLRPVPSYQFFARLYVYIIYL